MEAVRGVLGAALDALPVLVEVVSEDACVWADELVSDRAAGSSVDSTGFEPASSVVRVGAGTAPDDAAPGAEVDPALADVGALVAVAVGPTGLLVGRTGVLVGSIGVLVGSIGVLVGSIGVLVGSIGVAVGSIGVRVASIGDRDVVTDCPGVGSGTPPPPQAASRNREATATSPAAANLLTDFDMSAPARRGQGTWTVLFRAP